MNCCLCDAGVPAVKRTVVPVVLANGKTVYWRLNEDMHKEICSHFMPQPWYSGIVRLYYRVRGWFLRVFFGVHICVKPTGTISTVYNTSSGIHPRFSMNYKRDNGLQKADR
jgi:hypothetical protein